MSTAQTNAGVLEIPTIDIAPFRDAASSEADRDAVARQIDLTGRTVGFMQIVGHGIHAATLAAFTEATDAFFALDATTKSAYRCPPGVNRGYTPPRAESLANSLGIATAADLFEAINVGADATTYPDAPDLPLPEYAGNTYPAEVPGFEAAVLAWFAAAGGVARTMTRAFARALDLPEDFFVPFTDHSLDVLRMINYRLPSPDVQLEPDQLGMGAHTDYGIVTVLWADQVPGLEILDGEGRWHPVQPADGALLVNLGDALARWTNDRWISTMHRVAAPVVDGRLVHRRSAAFFHDGNIDAVIATLPGCVDDDHPAHYEPVTVREHVAQKLAGSRGGYLNPNATRDAARLGV